MKREIVIGIVIIVLVVGGATIYTAFDSGYLSGSTNGTISVTDTVNRTVQVPTKVNKVVAVGCTAREVVYLNASDKLVGIEQMETNQSGSWGNQLPYTVAHPELMSLPVVGNAKTNTINYEEIAKLSPDVVFASTAQDADNIQNKTGIPAVVVYTSGVGTSQQMQMYEDSLKLMGKVLGKEQRANEINNYINSTEKDLTKRTNNVSSNKTVYLAGQAYYGSQGITSTNPNYPPFVMINASNVASGLNNTTSQAVQIDPEKLMSWNPNYIYVEGSGLAAVKNNTNQNPSYNNLTAIQSGNVYCVLSYCLYSYNKEEMFANAYYIGKMLYPSQFSDVNVDQKAQDIFTEFDGSSGSSAYNSMKSYYGAYQKVNL